VKLFLSPLLPSGEGTGFLSPLLASGEGIKGWGFLCA